MVFSDHSFDKTRFEGVEVMALEWQFLTADVFFSRVAPFFLGRAKMERDRLC